MFSAFFGLVSLVITIVAGIFAFGVARQYVRSRLRFVDAIRNPMTPWIVGLAAAVVTLPVAILPLITAGTSMVFGAAAGLGTASGIKALKRGE